MSDLSSSSTLTEVQAAYDDNASYAEDRDTAKARVFITACRILIRRTPAQATKGSNEVKLAVELLMKELEKAQEWLVARSEDDDVGPRVINPDLRKSRPWG